jgi:undecaprenyl diphosphate synthase
VKRIVNDGIPADKIDESLFADYLNVVRLPDPDLVIRTAGEMRLSNFLIWQAAYAEYYFTPVYWPDFDGGQVERALEAYASRDRRFGGLSENRNGHTPSTNGKHSDA